MIKPLSIIVIIFSLVLGSVCITGGNYQEAEAGWLSDLKKSAKNMEKSSEEVQDIADCAEKI